MQKLTFQPGPEFARQLDRKDELAAIRDQFVIRDPNLIYMDGNSLGRLPARTAARVDTAIRQEWGEDLIRGWAGGWYGAPQRVGEKIGRLLGAGPDQTIVADSTSVNLFKLALAALHACPGRTRIVTDEMNFPTDLYVLQGCRQMLGGRHTLHLAPSVDGIMADTDAIMDAIDEETALVAFSHPTFKSAYLYDVEAITRRAHDAGALVLWDLSHGVGAIPLELDRWGVDLAVGCSYKYLNGGPGAPAWLYIRRDLQDQLVSPIWGWWAHRAPFAFDLDYAPTAGITRFLVGTPPVLSLLAAEQGVDQVLEVGLERIRRKSVRLTSYMVFLADAILAPLGFELGSPRDPARRGSHVSIRHPHGYRISRALVEEMRVIPDFREPDNIRLGLAPLYTSFAEVWTAVDRIRQVMEENRFAHYAADRLAVT